MRTWLFSFFLIIASVCFSQIAIEMPDSIEANLDTVAIELKFDSIPVFTFFNPTDVPNHQSRITSLHTDANAKDGYFFAVIAFSILLTLIYLNSREMVRSSLKSLTSVQNTIQFSRTEKQSDGLFYLLYLSLFIFGVAFAAKYVLARMYGMDFGLGRIVFFTILFFLIDYLASYLFLLFTTNDKSIDMVQTVILTYPVLLSFVLWPSLFFVVLSALPTGNLFLVVILVVLGIIFLLKELRTLQVLRIEKIDIFSFHFFAYLCTFKFLPLFVMAKIVF